MADVLDVDLYGDGQSVLAFDGRVLEIFGPFLPNTGFGRAIVADSWRVHVKNLNVKATGPDKRGFREVAFGSSNLPDNLTFTKLDDTQWSRLQPLLDALGNASRPAAAASTSDDLLATKSSALQALLSQHDVHLSSQPEDLRKAVVSDLQAASVPIDPDSLVMRLTDPGQVDTMFEIYKRHGLLPPDATLD